MSLALVHSRARAGVDAPLVRVEVHLSGGLPVTQIVGLAETSVRESRERVRAALLCARFDFPQRRITLNLAPADLPKEGGRYDLAIALGILAASGQVDPQSLLQYEFLGELGLTGELRPVAGALPAAIAAAEAGRILVVPPGNAAEAALAEHADVRVARTLLECCAGLGNPRLLPPVERVDTTPLPLPDLADVRGQAHARRALEVAAAGGHHLLLIGSPGCGKTLLASRLPSLLPDTEETEALQLAAIASVSGEGLDPRRWRQRPFRAPHHSASAAALVGGGNPPCPGEISLAHHGVLFLDELKVRLSSCLTTQFGRSVRCPAKHARRTRVSAEAPPTTQSTMEIALGAAAAAAAAVPKPVAYLTELIARARVPVFANAIVVHMHRIISRFSGRVCCSEFRQSRSNPANDRSG